MAANRDIAAALQLLADFMELDGVNKYRTIAVEKAARRVAEADFSLADLAREGDLTDLPDIGPKIAAKITEYLDTGRIAELEEFRSRYPDDLVAIQRIQGVGPKTARKVWEELGVSSMDELEAAAADGRLAALPGLGPKTAANIIKAIGRLKARGSRLLLGEVLPVAEECVALLAALPEAREVACAGSVRRMKETVKDVDIIATASEPEALTGAFCSLPLVGDVIASGPTKCSVRTHAGVQIDLRVVPDGLYGNLLQHFTGSKEHNVALREHAISQGFKVSEYGVEETASGKVHECGSEAEVYDLLGMDYIPPELREDSGEIAAALAGALPRLVSGADIRGDLHVHSDWSDGHAPIREMARAAQELGYEYIAISDHSQSLGMTGGLTPEKLERQLEEVARINDGTEGFRIFTSIEVDVKADATLDLPDDSLAALDFVTVSIHSGFTQEMSQIMERLTAAMEHPLVRAIGHPTGRLINRRDPYEVDIEAIIATAARTGTALEVNSHFQRLDLCDLHARAAQDAGVRLVINSDAHHISDLRLLKYGIATARRGWVRPETILNTLTADRLARLLERPKSPTDT
ncbi:MAG: DNA polymerase/3'-5' exonuclease PolX [Gaiellales bacterium]|nr:MAG: DNA polymerase/3'-5' exonuclease PolX [Gaiellales bacterium]